MITRSNKSDALVSLRALRQIRHSSQGINDITRELTTLRNLKPGAIDNVIVHINEIAQAMQQLQSTPCQQELIQSRQTEVAR